VHLDVIRSRLIVLGLIAAVAICVSGCGGDDDDDAASGTDTAEVSGAPAPTQAFQGLSAALEAQGLVVSQLPKESRHGAEDGVKITGSKSGTGLLYSTEKQAQAYADQVASTGGGKTTIVGTVVFVAPTQEDADFFADAYEGG
jgi:alkanesulfonate monooxygenase SsuD/methylene tetrahydromethanopterin reductase-like flavin-dependent oxidoreductase (luciferase family)